MAKVSDDEFTSRPWLIHKIAPDFLLEDVWDIPVPGAVPDDFHAAVKVLRAGGGPDDFTGPTKWLWDLRLLLGRVLGLDRERDGLGARVESLRDRLPEELRRPSDVGRVDSSPFVELYERPDEAASEIANRTVHGVMHLGWVTKSDGQHLQMAVLVRPNGRLGKAYLGFIKPFRYLIVYPALTRNWERTLRQRFAPSPASGIRRA